MPGPKIHPRFIKTGGKIRKGFSTESAGPKVWLGTANRGVRSAGITKLKEEKHSLPSPDGYVPMRNRMPLLIVPDLTDFELKPYLSPRCETVETYPTSHHDVMAVMQAEGYKAPEQRPIVPSVPKGDRFGFPRKKSVEEQVDEARMNIPESVHQRLVDFANKPYLPNPKPKNPAVQFRGQRSIFWVPKEFRGPAHGRRS